MNDAKTIGSNALVLDTAEENVTVMNAEESKLGNEVSLIEQRAEAVVVASGADFEDAGLFLKQIKQAQKQVKDYWEPLRVSAKKSYDEVLTHRKEMIEPLEKAEKIVKTYVYACLVSKKCCICGKPCDLHHVDHVGAGRDREEIIHEGMEVLPLCREHHSEVHVIGWLTFQKKHHLTRGVLLDKHLCKLYRLKRKEETENAEQDNLDGQIDP